MGAHLLFDIMVLNLELCYCCCMYFKTSYNFVVTKVGMANSENLNYILRDCNPTN